MQQNTLKENKMGTMSIGKLILVMSAPMMASMLFQALYNIVDSIFVARLSQDAMNAVSLAFPFQSLCIAVGTGTGVGMNALLSRSLGQKDYENVNRTAGTGIFLYLCSMIVFSLLGFTMVKPFYGFLTDNSAILDYGTAYLTICIGCCYPLFAQMCSERLLQSTGRTDLAMIPQITGAVFNMAFDPILIFGLLGFPRLEVMGAAVATVCGQILATIVGIVLNLKKNKEINFSFKAIRPYAPAVKEIYRIGLPSIIMQGIGSFLNFVLNSILIGFTEAATAVFGAYYKIQSIIFMPIFGMNNALVPIVSYNFGARKKERVRRAARLCILIAISIMSVGTLLFELIPDVLLGLFSPSEEMLAVGRTALRVIGVHFPVAGFCIVSGSVCQALGKPIYSMITSIMRQLVVLLPAAYLLSLTGHVEAVWWAFPIAAVVSAIFSTIFYRRVLKRLNNI
ncbi:MAG: MATE family efflux transporter [Clostridia bacterium]|nr:MATE family efflux transporter [Clostridia bacterium]